LARGLPPPRYSGPHPALSDARAQGERPLRRPARRHSLRHPPWRRPHPPSWLTERGRGALDGPEGVRVVSMLLCEMRQFRKPPGAKILRAPWRRGGENGLCFSFVEGRGRPILTPDRWLDVRSSKARVRDVHDAAFGRGARGARGGERLASQARKTRGVHDVINVWGRFLGPGHRTAISNPTHGRDWREPSGVPELRVLL